MNSLQCHVTTREPHFFNKGLEMIERLICGHINNNNDFHSPPRYYIAKIFRLLQCTQDLLDFTPPLTIPFSKITRSTSGKIIK